MPRAGQAAVETFYADHDLLVMQTMLRRRRDRAAGMSRCSGPSSTTGLAATEAWTPDYLARLALDSARPAA